MQGGEKTDRKLVTQQEPFQAVGRNCNNAMVGHGSLNAAWTESVFRNCTVPTHDKTPLQTSPAAIKLETKLRDEHVHGAIEVPEISGVPEVPEVPEP